MGFNPVCPECGFESDEVRCPRCNTLKVSGCQGSCWSCGDSVGCKPEVTDETSSDDGRRAIEDDRGSLFDELLGDKQ